MSSIEDKILDGPTVHYCDADDDDIRTGEDAGFDKDDPQTPTRNDITSLFVRPDPESEPIPQCRHLGHSMNTGPKGVIEDHRNHSLSTSSKVDDSELEKEFSELLNDDSIIRTLAEKRIAQAQANKPCFGFVLRLNTGSELLEAIDNEDPNVIVTVLIYTRSRACTKVDRCLDNLAKELNYVKFVTLSASAASLSENFKKNGVPALLAYKGGKLMKSIIKLEEYLDKSYEVSDLKELLIDIFS